MTRAAARHDAAKARRADLRPACLFCIATTGRGAGEPHARLRPALVEKANVYRDRVTAGPVRRCS